MTEASAAGIVITTKDVYDKLVDVEKMVYTMTPQAQILQDHEGRLRVVEGALPEQLEARLRSVEKWKWSIPPTFVAAAIAIAEQLLGRKP